MRRGADYGRTASGSIAGVRLVPMGDCRVESVRALPLDRGVCSKWFWGQNPAIG